LTEIVFLIAIYNYYKVFVAMAEIAQYPESNALIVNSFFLIFGSFSTKVVL